MKRRRSYGVGALQAPLQTQEDISNRPKDSNWTLQLPDKKEPLETSRQLVKEAFGDVQEALSEGRRRRVLLLHPLEVSEWLHILDTTVEEGCDKRTIIIISWKL